MAFENAALFASLLQYSCISYAIPRVIDLQSEIATVVGFADVPAESVYTAGQLLQYVNILQPRIPWPVEA